MLTIILLGEKERGEKKRESLPYTANFHNPILQFPNNFQNSPKDIKY